jgi:hypothetical protein
MEKKIPADLLALIPASDRANELYMRGLFSSFDPSKSAEMRRTLIGLYGPGDAGADPGGGAVDLIPEEERRLDALLGKPAKLPDPPPYTPTAPPGDVSDPKNNPLIPKDSY